MKAFGKYDRDSLLSMSTAESVFWQMGHQLALSGRHSLHETIESLPQLYSRLPSGVDLQVLSMIEEGNKVAVEAESHGVLVDGAPYRNQHHNVLRFNQEGKVIEYRDYPDTLVLSELLSGRALSDEPEDRHAGRRFRPSILARLLPYLAVRRHARHRLANPPGSARAGTSLERNRTNALAFIEAIGAQDLLTMGSLYAARGSFWQVGHQLVTSGRHSLLEIAHFVPSIYRRFPNGLEFENRSIVAEGDRVAVESASRAALRNGTEYHNHYNFLFQFDRRGKVLVFKEYWGTLHAFETLFDGRTVL